MKTILLKLSGPLQSWGTGSRFESRSTDRHPSKSAIIGMIAASFGYRRDDDRIAALNHLDFAVRIDQEGTILRDYHIAGKYTESGKVVRTYVTNRYYLQDAVFLVALGSENHSLIDRIEAAINEPYFQPFLGRRALPVNYDMFQGTFNKGVMEVLAKEKWRASEWYQKKQKGKNDQIRLEVAADQHLIEGDKRIKMIQDQVQTFSQKNRIHQFRGVSKTTIILDNLFEDFETRHDIFDAIGGGNVPI